MDKAVRAARTAFEGSWRQTDGTARGRLLLKLADLVEGEIETLATIETLDTGKPFSSALGDIQEVYSVLRYFGGWADKTYGQTIETGRHKFTYTIRQPIGVCGQIVPYDMIESTNGAILLTVTGGIILWQWCHGKSVLRWLAVTR